MNINKIILLSVFSLLSLSSLAHESSEAIYKADTGSILGKSINFYQAFGDICIYLKILKSGGMGAAEDKLDICEMDKKKFGDDFADVEFKGGEFKEDILYLYIETTELRSLFRNNYQCNVTIKNEKLALLGCERIPKNKNSNYN